MSTIVTRAGKGSPLTHTEVDANFTNLNTDKLEVGAAFNAAVAATPAVTANTAKVTNATHTGDVTGATALTIANDAVTNAKAADMATARIKGQEAQARVDMMKAQTMKLLTEAGVMLSEQQLNEFNSLADIELRKNGQAMDAAQPEMGEGGEMDEEAEKPKPMTTETVMEGLAMLGQMMQQQSALLARIEAAQTAPTEIVRGPDGRAIGARKVLQ